MLISILLSSLVVMIASLAGVALLWKGAGEFVEKNLKFLVSLSAGVFIVIAFQMVVETLEHSTGAGQSVFWIFVGALCVFMVFKLLPSFHHHHNVHGEDHPHSRLDVRHIIVGDGIHNVADGVLLASSFALSPSLGVITTVSVFFHEVVQEISEFFVMRQAGYSTKKALVINFVVSSTILIGSVGAFLLLEQFKMLEVPLLGVSAGVFLLVVLFDLIPHSVRHSKERIHHVVHFFCFAIGMGLMASVIILSPHVHDNEEHVDHVEEKYYEVHQE